MNDKKRFLSSTQAAKHFGVCPTTIRKWEANGILKSYRIGGSLVGHRRIDIESFNNKIKLTNDYLQNTDKKNTITEFHNNDQNFKQQTIGAIYCRVSSHHQKDDLDRQIKAIQQLYPKHQIFKDVGSGINFKRPNFLKLIENAIAGNFNEIVVAHKDRFSRFAFEFFEWLLQQYNVKLLVLDKDDHKSDEQELAEDLLSIVHDFSCRQNGKRKYKNKENKNIETKEKN